MDKIIQFNDKFFNSIEGVLPEVSDKTKIKKIMASIISENKVKGSLITDEGDIEEDVRSFDTKNAVAIFLYVDEDYFKILEPRTKEDEDDSEENLTFILVDTVEIEGWILGKCFKKLNGVRIASDELIAVRKQKVTELPITTDNYIEANLTWIFDQLVDDYSEKYEDEEDEEMDDGD